MAFTLIGRTNFGGPVEPLKVGDIVYVKPRIIKLNGKMEFSFDVAIHEPKVVELGRCMKRSISCSSW